MQDFRADPSRVVVLGAGRGGTAMLEMLSGEPLADVVAVVDKNPDAEGMKYARSMGIATYQDVKEALLACAPCIAFNLTNNEMVEEMAYDVLGAGGVIGGLEARFIWHMVTGLKKTKEELRYQATHDVLTGLYNRRFVTEQLEQQVSQAIRYGMVCSLILIDLDHFKHVNDTYGHAAGDLVLQSIAKKLRGSARSSDVIGRWGGEEFLVVLPHTHVKDATVAANQWLKRVQEEPICLPDGQILHVSFSAGVGSLCADKGKTVQTCIDDTLEMTDRLLYQAKRKGRACVVGVDE